MLKNALTAPELLRNKGITLKTWEQWDKTVDTLPCTGEKQYEPNNSWLQNKQIDKGLKDRKNLLGIERVERNSQLAAAEWLPQQSRARVTKKSGQEWTSFGIEENLELYLIPEEALLLLESNCLELSCNGVPLSIHQAYSVLLGSDRPKCNIDEYRVYSHLVRQGFRLQRFHYDRNRIFDKSPTSQSSVSKRKKLIHNPVDGFGMSKNPAQVDVDGDSREDSLSSGMGVPNERQFAEKSASNPHAEHVTCRKTTEELNECLTDKEPSVGTVTQLETTGLQADDNAENASIGNEDETSARLLNVESRPLSEHKRCIFHGMRADKKLPSELYDNGIVNLPGPSHVEAKKLVKNTGKDSKLRIISDETFLGDFEIISKWPGTRIQRNVKWIPKRNTGGLVGPIMEEINDVLSLIGSTKSRIIGLPTSSGTTMDVGNSRGRKRQAERGNEVIEVSDDEVEEVPQKLSRKEMLNLFPNVISGAFVAKWTSKRYLPRNICPQGISKQFIQWKVSNVEKHENKDVCDVTCYGSEENSRSTSKDAASSMITSESSHKNISTDIILLGSEPRLGNNVAVGFPYKNTVYPNNYTPGADLDKVSISYRKDVSQQVSRFCKGSSESKTTYRRFFAPAAGQIPQMNKGVFEEQECVSMQFGMYANIAVTQSLTEKLQFLKRGLNHRQNMWTNMNYCPWKENLMNVMARPVSYFPNITHQRSIDNTRRTWDATRYSCNNNRPGSRTEIGESSFKIVPGASCWAETKAKWLDERIITIEDEDCRCDVDTTADKSKIKVVVEPVKPLVGKQNATSIAQVYKNLQIISSATTKNSRCSRDTNRTDYYRISYNLYSTAQRYKKSSLGTPMYRIAVFRAKDTPFIELADIVRLRENAKGAPVVMACVSRTSVTFAELGTVMISDVPRYLYQALDDDGWTEKMKPLFQSS